MTYSRKRLAAVTAGVAGAALLLAAPASASVQSWAGTWTGSPVAGATSSTCPAGPGGVVNQTVRDIVFTSVAGHEVRVRLSNAFGTSPLTVGAASVAIDQSGAQTVPGTLRTLSFSGSGSVTIPAGSEVTSDPVQLSVGQLQELAVSVYVPQLTGPATYHPASQENNFLSAPGNFAGDPAATAFGTTISCWMFADGVDVIPASPRVAGSVIALGDSITDGNASGVGANHRWPNFLATRLDAQPGHTLSIVDEGISGNRVLSDAGTSGVSLLNRLDRDVLTQPGARDVILLEGINDIGQSDLGTIPTVTAADLIAGYQQVIARAHAAGLRIFGATLTPFGGASYWSAAGEQTREAVNQWIRTSGAFDGVVDFASATASPDNPEVFNPAFDSGDHLHPNATGYQAMAQAVSLGMVLRQPRLSLAVRQTLGEQSVTVSAPHIIEGGSAETVTTTYANSGQLAVHHVQERLRVPSGWAVQPASPSLLATVSPGQAETTTWRVTAAASASPATYVLTAAATYQAGPGTDTVTAPSDVAVPIPSLAAAYDNTGITDDANPAAGAFLNSGKTYSAQALAAAGIIQGGTVTYDGTSFTWPDAAPGQADNVEANGQVIAVSGQGSALAFLGASASGTRGGAATVYYTDGSSQQFSLSFSDWWTPAPSDHVVATAAYINAPAGRYDHIGCVYYAAVPLDPGKTVAAVALPITGVSPVPGLHVFSLAVASGAEDR